MEEVERSDDGGGGGEGEKVAAVRDMTHISLTSCVAKGTSSLERKQSFRPTSLPKTSPLPSQQQPSYLRYQYIVRTQTNS